MTLFLRKGLSIGERLMVSISRKDFAKDCYVTLFSRKRLPIGRGLMVSISEKDKRTALIARCNIYIYITPGNQGSPFVLFKKDFAKDCYVTLFSRKRLSIGRGLMVSI